MEVETSHDAVLSSVQETYKQLFRVRRHVQKMFSLHRSAVGEWVAREIKRLRKGVEIAGRYPCPLQPDQQQQTRCE